MLSVLIGAISGILPSIIKIFERKQELQHEAEMAKIRIDTMVKANELGIKLEEVKADINEGESLRSHDSGLDGGKFINGLRASVRPVITYIFFGLFCFIKIAALCTITTKTNIGYLEGLKVVWDVETQAIFGYGGLS